MRDYRLDSELGAQRREPAAGSGDDLGQHELPCRVVEPSEANHEDGADGVDQNADDLHTLQRSVERPEADDSPPRSCIDDST